MLLEVLKGKKNFTNSEIVISEYILKHIEDMYQMTAEKLAQNTYTSKATVVRFCKKLMDGKGYQEFKLLLMAEITEIREMNRKNMNVIRDFYNYNAREVIQELYYIAETTARITVNESNISSIAERITRTDFIDLFGTGLDFCYARETAYKFRRLEIFATALDDLYEYDINEKNKKKIAMVFGIQKPLSYVDNLSKELKLRDYYVVSFIDGEEARIDDLYLGNIFFPVKAVLSLRIV